MKFVAITACRAFKLAVDVRRKQPFSKPSRLIQMCCRGGKVAHRGAHADGDRVYGSQKGPCIDGLVAGNDNLRDSGRRRRAGEQN